jgi:hypothetical protein
MADCRRRSHRLLTRACAGPPTDVLELIDELRGLVLGAKRVPLRDRVRVDKKKLYDGLDEVRSTVPEEVRQARWIVTEREEMLAEAKREAERMIEDARGRRTQLAPGMRSVARLSVRQDIIDDARARERGIRLGAQECAAEIFDTLEARSPGSSPPSNAAASACSVPTRPARSSNAPAVAPHDRPSAAGSRERSRAATGTYTRHPAHGKTGLSPLAPHAGTPSRGVCCEQRWGGSAGVRRPPHVSFMRARAPAAPPSRG